MNRATAEKKKMETYYWIDAVRPRVCTGCGRGDKPLDHSHLIPQQRLVRFDPALIAESELITLHCRDCHRKFENHDPNLEDFEENLAIIKKYDFDQYNFIKQRAGYNQAG